jgi:hypothetical protein
VELAPDEAGALGWIIGRIVGGEGA